MMIKAVLFDCFGVLISDALDDIVTALRQDEPGRAQQIVDIIAAASRGTISTDTSRDRVAAILGVSANDYVERLKNEEIKNVELMQYIRRLRTNYKTALLSNISSSGLISRFTDVELDRHFDVVVASGVVGYAKPEARIYELTAERLGVRLDECVFLDDRIEYCEGATAVGMQAIHYKSFTQATTDLENVLAISR